MIQIQRYAKRKSKKLLKIVQKIQPRAAENLALMDFCLCAGELI